MQTNETPLAAYLIQSGFSLLEIVYEVKPGGKRQGFFVFEDSPELKAHTDLFSTGTPSISLVLYERTKAGLIDRIMRGQQ